MVDRYNTGDPRPSNSMKNLSDNALAFDDFVNSDGDNAVDRFGKEFPTISKLIKNVDEIFSSQLSIQESTFSESQTDKENRFQQFLNTSGYVFLGDYQDGPFQFSARNQYIRYDNQYYRLNAATDVGFTTTGTDATSFASDVTHFVLMDGDTLRQNLGSGELPGSSLVALLQGGTLHDAIRWVSPRMMAGCPTDGETDAGIYLQRAINKAKELNLPLNIDGVFKSSVALDWSSDNPIKIFGFTPETCRIIFTNAAAYGLTITQNNATDFIEIVGVSITSAALITTAKALLTIDATPQITTDISAGKYLLGSRTIRRGKLHNINIDVATDCYFVNGVQFKSWMNYSIDTVLVRGGRLNLTSATNGFLLSGDGYPVDIHMTNLWMYNLGRAINSVDYIEGLHVSHFEFVNVLRGVSGAYDASYSTLAESLCAIYSPFLSAGHVNLGTFTGADVCLYLKNVTTPNLSHMFLFASAGADVTSANGVKLMNCIGGSVRDVTVAGSGAANTKTNNFSICLDSCKRVVVSGCRGTVAGAAIRLQGGSVNNIISDNTGESCVNTVSVESTSDSLNKITSSNRGVSLSGYVVGGTPSANDMEPVIYHRAFSLTFSASQAVGSTLTFNIPLVTGTFGVAPDAAGLELPSGLYAIASYDKSNSTASSARMTLYFLVAASAGTYSLSFRASALATSRTQ